MTKVFISYSRKDKEITKRLAGELQKRGLDFWIDWEGLPLSADWWEKIEKGIEEADSFIFLISPDSVHSEICGRELDHAVRKNKRVIPIIVRELDSNSKFPESLLHLDRFQLTNGESWETITSSKDPNYTLDKLISAIYLDDEEWAMTCKNLEFKALEWDFNKRDKKYLLYNDEYLKVLKKIELAQTLKKEPRPKSLHFEYMEACYRANGGKIGRLLKRKTGKPRVQQLSKNVFSPGKYFISHSYGDAPIRDKLIGRLPPGIEPFIFPPITVNPQDFVSNHLIEAILSCDGVIYLRGGKSAQSFWVAFERDFALRNGMPVYAADPDTLTIERDFSNSLDLAVYASFHRKDKERVQEIVDFMMKNRHFDVWIDWEKIPQRADWFRELNLHMREAIYRGGYQIVFWSEWAAHSEVIEKEIEGALEAVPNIKNPRTLFALLEKESIPEKLYLKGYKEPPVQLYGDDERSETHRLDDLIVRLYWLMYQNPKGL